MPAELIPPDMDPKEVHARVRDTLGKRTFIVVSNREPYEHVHGKKGIVVRKTIGGLVTALDPMMRTMGGTWIAWGSGEADREVVDTHDAVLVPPEERSYRLRRVWLQEEEVKKFYDGHVNQTLWPLCHLQTEKVRFFRDEWDVYQSVNRRFAEAAAAETGDDDGVVWFQDYHFATAPAILRSLRPRTTILQFWHIPWPPWEIFRRHPQRRAILEGLLGCDIIGMHIDLFCENFLECVRRELHLPVDFEKKHVLADNRTIRIRTLPISVDAKEIHDLAQTPRVKSLADDLRKKYAPASERIGLGVERGDYTKGILLRLRALDHLFLKYPQWRGKFSFVQITPVSRERIPAYMIFQKEMDRQIRELNARYGTETWKPVIHIRTAQKWENIIATLTVADVAIVSARQDGMNLVAKEYVAARSDERGVLILSEFAGAADQLPQSLLINPWDVEGFAAAIDRALTMTATEQRTRMRQLRQHLFCNTIYDWIDRTFEEVALLSAANHAGGYLLDRLNVVEGQVKRFKHVEIFCDYDGVLTPIAPRPQDARIGDTMRMLLAKFRDSAAAHVCIISGRSIDDVSELVSIERLTYAGNHGLEIEGPRVRRIHPDAEKVHAMLQGLYEDLRRAMRPFSGVIVENKQLGLSLHYRLADPARLNDILSTFYDLFERRNAADMLRVTTGKAVAEVRPNVEWDKGRAAAWILEQIHGPAWRDSVLPIYLGDDDTDEDAFRALRRSGVTIRVGPATARTYAKYTLKDTGDVAVFLTWLSGILQ